MIDDWWAHDNAPHALEKLLTLSYDPEAAGDPRRYRPGYTAVWNYLQWHAVGDGNLLVATGWNLVRLAVFVGALVAVPFAAARRAGVGPVTLAGLAAMTPALVLVTPAVGQELAKFGPVEPMLVGGMLSGALLLLLGLERWNRRVGARAVPLWQVVWPLGAGYALWLLGVYMKEASVSFLVMAPFLYMALARRWRERESARGSLAAHRPFQILAFAMLLPVVHMLVRVLVFAGEGRTVYGARVPRSVSGIASWIGDSLTEQWRAMTPLLITPLWRAVAIASLVLVFAFVVERRRFPWLAAGFLTTAGAVMAFQGLSGGGAAARYFIAVIALLGIGAALLLAEGPSWLRVGAILATAVLVASAVDGARANVETWSLGERAGNRLVDFVADLDPARCPVYVGGLDVELADALPVLVGRENRPARSTCDAAYAGYLVSRTDPSIVETVTNDAIFDACEPPGWRPVATMLYYHVLACAQFRDRTTTGESVAQVLSDNRLLPGEPYSEGTASVKSSD